MKEKLIFEVLLVVIEDTLLAKLTFLILIYER